MCSPVADSLSSRTDLLASDDETGSDTRDVTGHNDSVDTMDTSRTSMVAVYMGVALVGIGSSFVMNALWVQLPLLMQRTPEGVNLPVYLLLVFECSHVMLVSYLVVRRCSRRVVSDVPYVYSSYVLSLTALLLLAVFWHHTTDIATRPHSFVLFVGALLGSIVACVSNITYAGFAARLRTRYMSAIVLGDSLSASIPHFLSVAQGVGRATDCPRQHSVDSGNHTAAFVVNGRYLTETLSRSPNIQRQSLRYSESTFFFLSAAFVLASAVAFVNMRCKETCKRQYDDVVDCADLELRGLHRGHNSVTREQGYVLDDGSIRHVRPCSPKTHGSHDHTRYYDRRKGRDSNGADAACACSLDLTGCDVTTDIGDETDYRDGVAQSDKPNLFPLLLVITFWISSVLNGPASVAKSHACYPTANGPFNVGSIVSDVVIMLACPLAARCVAKNRITFIVAFTALGTIVVFYFAALVWFSRTVDGARNSLLFGDPGELLTVSEGGREGGMEGVRE